jgi:hypothetical protein
MSLRLDVIPGNPATGADEADVALTASLLDIRCNLPATTTCGSANAPGAPDYAGELEARLILRITDRQNTPYPGGPGPGTTSEVPLSVAIPCGPTDDTIGADCSITTTADTVAGASTAKEGARALWELGQVEVRDGGADGDADTTAGNSTFAVQGVFVP